MLKEIRLQNFRCFSDHTLPLRPQSVIIGRNNAGKSTLVEALRLISVITERYQSLTFRSPPPWSTLPVREKGVSPAKDQFDFSSENVFHRYGEPPAIISAKFSNDSFLRVHIGPGGSIYAMINDSQGRPLQSKADAKNAQLPHVAVMPQLGPVARTETPLNVDYVRRSMSSILSSQHFRNQIRQHPQFFESFAQLTDETWGMVQIRPIEGGGDRDEPLTFFVRDGNFESEIASLGHGLQMWLQTMWFLSRMPPAATVILDEPDVYMHPDLQRRLIRHVQKRFAQSIVTTHSVEIISEVMTDDILIIDRSLQASKFASSLPSVQEVLERVGSAHNLQLTRLWNARKCILVEGRDMQLLSRLHSVIYPRDADGFAQVPNMSLGGWTGWPQAAGSALLLRNSGGSRILVYCLFDSDFHTEGEIRERYVQARDHGIQLHIWKRKEIENYLLVPEAIRRYIADRVAVRTQPPQLQEVIAALEDIAASLYEDTFDAMVSEIHAKERANGPAGANRQARAVMVERWATFDERLKVISGKSALSKLSQWSKDTFGVSISTAGLAQGLREGELDRELVAVIQAMHDGRAFLPR